MHAMKSSIKILVAALSLTWCLSPATSQAGQSTPRIVGGVEAGVNEFPFIVSLQRGSHFCGGSLIAPDWVLTAAHCVRGSTSLKIVLGLHDQKNPANADVIQSKRIIAHPKYSSGSMDWDFALIQLERPSSFETIALNHGEIDVDDESIMTITAGWGATHEGSWTLPNLLQKVEVPLVSRATCNEAYPNRITDRMVCAGYKQGGKDACQGDSGGPLLVETRSRHRVLVGVVSWGQGCARPQKYGVYSNVAAVTDWIYETMASAQ